MFVLFLLLPMYVCKVIQLNMIVYTKYNMKSTKQQCRTQHCEDMHVSSFLRRFKVAAVTYHLLLEELQDVHCEEA